MKTFSQFSSLLSLSLSLTTTTHTRSAQSASINNGEMVFWNEVNEKQERERRKPKEISVPF